MRIRLLLARSARPTCNPLVLYSVYRPTKKRIDILEKLTVAESKIAGLYRRIDQETRHAKRIDWFSSTRILSNIHSAAYWSADIMADSVWLHVPLETVRGKWLSAGAGRRFNVLGRPAQLIEINLDPPGSLGRVNIGSSRQALLFDPMPKDEARKIFVILCRRLPVLAFKRNSPIRVADAELHEAVTDHQGHHDFRHATLIPAELKPKPYGAGNASIEYEDAASVLAGLNALKSVDDERVITAIDLLVATHYETQPRSIFLLYLTIIDSLAERPSRPRAALDWIEAKVREAKLLNDQSLESALNNLKEISHGSAIRQLVTRTEQAFGANSKEVKRQCSLAAELYRVRSRLSHQGALPPTLQDVADARTLAYRVVGAAIDNPSILGNPGATIATTKRPTPVRRILRYLSNCLACFAAWLRGL